MSLTRCPKCNADTSSYAVSCLKCGLNVREYYLNRYKKKVEEEYKKIDGMKPMAYAKKPNFFRSLFFRNDKLTLLDYILFFVPIIILIAAFTENTISMVLAYVCAVIVTFGLPLSVLAAWWDFTADRDTYNTYKEQHHNFDYYKEKCKAKVLDEYKERIRNYSTPRIADKKYEEDKEELDRKHYRENVKHEIVIQCPSCGTIDVSYIPRRGKYKARENNYKCDKCGCEF